MMIAGQNSAGLQVRYEKRGEGEEGGEGSKLDGDELEREEE